MKGSSSARQRKRTLSRAVQHVSAAQLWNPNKGAPQGRPRAGELGEDGPRRSDRPSGIRCQTRGMGQLLAVVLLIAVVDSANPSTIAPALYLAAGQRAGHSLLGFIVGVVVVYFLGGLLIVLGPGQALLALIPRPGLETRHLIELCLGVGLIVLAGVLWFGRKRVGRDVARDEDRFDRSSFLVGAGISLVELPTAFPYFAAMAAIVSSGKNVITQIAVLVAYNAVFVAPLLAILGVRLLARESGQRWLERLRADLDKRLAMLLPGLALVAAVALIVLGAVGTVTD
jgi:cytochrome c biogenesis protein CcdA